MYKSVEKELLEFITERNWSDVYTIKDISVCLFSEFGELTKIIEWKCDSEAVSLEITEGVGRECADIMIFIMHLCRLIDVDSEKFSLFDSK